MNIEPRQIEIFRAIMLSGSVTSAAAQLFTSQPTVSRELARLEKSLGFALFDRVRGRLQPTARALALYEEVQRVWVSLDSILARATALRGFAHAALSIACVPMFAHTLLPTACRRFAAQYPEVGISINTAESPLLDEGLSAQRFDLGLCEQPSAPPGTRLETLFEADEICVLPPGHPLGTRPILQPEDFADQTFISLAPGDPYRQQIDAVFHAHRVSRKLLHETQTAASVCELVREGLGVAIVNPLTALDYAERGLALRRFSISIPFRVSLVRPEFRPSTPLTDAFASALSTALADIRKRIADTTTFG